MAFIIYSRCFIYGNDGCRIFIPVFLLQAEMCYHIYKVGQTQNSKFTWECVSRYCWRKNAQSLQILLLFFFSLSLLEDSAVKC